MNLSENFRRLVEETRDYQEGDYEKDGLLHCGKCNTPKETKANYSGCIEFIGSQPDTLPIMCECSEKFYNEQRAKEKAMETSQRIAEIKKRYIFDTQYLEMTFDKADNLQELQWALNYVNAWEDIKGDRGAGLFLFGDTGTGKTFTACCIGNALIEKGHSVMIANIVDLMDKVADFEQKEETLWKIQKCSLLIIDDFGVTRNSDFADEQVYKIIDTRYRSNKPMIVTTNLSPQELMTPEHVGLKRTYQRVIEVCRAVPFTGENRRTGIAKQSKRRLDDILFGGQNAKV